MENLDTKVGSSIFISGNLEGEGNVYVEGRIDGSISIKGDLHIDPSGQIKSTVQARNIYVMGLLVGDAIASEKVELAPGGRMIGDVRAPRLLINDGALYRGNVTMVDFAIDERLNESRRVGVPRVATQISRNASLLRAQNRSASSRPTVPASVTTRRKVAVAAKVESETPGREPAMVGVGGPAVNASLSASQKTPTANLYTPPPLPRPPEFLGARKAIVIKRKTTDGE